MCIRSSLEQLTLSVTLCLPVVRLPQIKINFNPPNKLFHAHVHSLFFLKTDIIAQVRVRSFSNQANFFAQARPNHFHK
jgi:hypothetical protein